MGRVPYGTRPVESGLLNRLRDPMTSLHPCFISDRMRDMRKLEGESASEGK